MTLGENLLAAEDVAPGGTCTPGQPLVIPAPTPAADAAAIKVLGDTTRLQIVRILAANGAVCACDLESPLGLSQPTVSHHLRQLVSAGLVSRDKRGTWAFYSVNREKLAATASALTEL